MTPAKILLTLGFLCFSAFAYGLKDVKLLKDFPGIDPDIFRNVSQLITSKGYPVEEYDVKTSDGYILSVQRIPHGRGGKNTGPKKAVYVQHGLLADSSCFVLDFPNVSLGYVLADAGYDVWLGNTRGNTYCRRHTKYSPKSKEFWDFTYDEMAKYDLPAIIDLILNTTGQTQLYYIGHSQGTTVMFALLSENSEYNDKIKLGIAMAPVATLGYTNSPIRFLAPFSHEIEFLLHLLGVNEFSPQRSLINILKEFICDVEAQKWCENIEFLLNGIDVAQLNETRYPVYISHTPSGTSSLNVIHWAQMINTKNFQKMDYGKKENMKRYGQSTPPLYHVENIIAPVAIMWGLNDLSADPADVALLAQKLKNMVVNYQVPYPLWTHLDFAMGIDANKYVYSEIIKLINKY